MRITARLLEGCIVSGVGGSVDMAMSKRTPQAVIQQT
jgi:hypothetical protein